MPDETGVENVYTIPRGPTAPMHFQALHQLVERCAEISSLYPDEAAALTRRINQFHAELIEAPIEQLRIEQLRKERR